MGFSLMRSKPEYPLDVFTELPQLGDPWVLGKKLGDLPHVPIEYRLSAHCDDTPYPMYELPHPLIRKDLLEQLVKAGVDNIETRKAILHHPQAGTLRDDYLAFNIAGMVATSAFAADIMRNYAELEFETDEIAGIIPDYSAIPEGIRLARLADRMGRIIVNDRVRERIDFGPDSGLVFFELNGGA